jgi:FlaA1/EpsC-like NDP-sugar epimerase
MIRRRIELLRQSLLHLSRREKRVLQLAVDVVLIWIALWLSFAVRVGSWDAARPFSGHGWLFLLAPVIALPIFIRLGMYRAVMRYVGNDALVTIAKAVTLSALVLSLAVYWYRGPTALVPRSMVFNYWWLSLLLLGGLRLTMRQFFIGDWFEPIARRRDIESGTSKVAIYGAGAAGNQLVAALRLGKTMRPAAFIDDDSGIATRTIAGLRVYSPKHIQQMINETGVTEVLLAMPSVSRARRREILEALEPYALHVRSIPGFMDLASGRVKVEDLQEVDIADLLGRDAVPPRQDLFEHCIKNQVVLVTGAGGSIGSELCRQILASGARTLLLFEHSEFNLYSIHGELQQRIERESLPIKLVPILGSIRNFERLLDILQTWRVNTVYHAAAYKHVPMVEHNVAEGVLNNLVGTLNAVVAQLNTTSMAWLAKMYSRLVLSSASSR